MVLKIEDRVRETTTTTGTGTLDLLGPVTGFQSFVTAIGDGNTSYYAIVHRTADEWELGIGTVDDQTTDTLARTTVVSSSNSGNAVSFSAGVKDVFVTLPSSKSLFITGSDSVVIGNGAAGVDYSLTFDGETNDGVLTWMEDEDYFQLSDDLLLSTTEKLYFRDTAISINSSADGQLDLIADTEIQIAATTVDINGAVDISGTLGVTGVVSGAGFTAGNAVLAEAELELLDGLTAGTAIASKVVTTDANIDTTGQRNITLTGELDAGSLDIEGDADINGTLEADAITVAGVALNTVIAGVTVTNATNAVNSTHVSVADNENTNEENLIPFIEDASATGNVGLESDGDFAYNPSTGTVSATIFKGNIDAVDGDFDGTLEADAITVGGTALASVIATTTVNTATVATTVTITDNEDTNENNALIFTSGGDLDGGNLGLESDGDLKYNPSTGTLSVPNVSVSGTFSTVNSVTMDANNAVIFEGSTADAHETTLTSIDATDDRTISLPNVSGTLPVLAAVSTTAITSTPEELNALDGITAVVGELNALDIGSTAVGTAVASKAVILDSNKDYTGVRNFTLSGELDAGSLDITGDADIDGTLEADAITVDGTALATVIAGTTVTNATNSAHVLVTDNESTNEENLIAFVEGATSSTGNVGLEMDGNFAYNPSTGTVSATVFKGNIDAVDGDFDGTLEADAITIGGTAIGSIYSVIAGSSNIVTTGALNSGSITSGFGTIDTGSSTITTTGVISGGGFTAGNAVLAEAELELLDGLTAGTAIASKVVTTDANKDTTGQRNLTITGELDAATLDISGAIDVAGTANLDVVDIDGAVDMATTLTLAGNADFNGDLDVDGTTNLDVVDIDGALTQDGGAVFNEASADVDFRIEGNGDANTFFLDGEVDRIYLGHNANTNINGLDARLQISGTSKDQSALSLSRYSADANPPSIAFAKSRNASIAGNTIVQSGDILGRIRFAGADGGDFGNAAAQIDAVVDGTPGVNDMPGRLSFSTAADGATSATERMRISSAGTVLVGKTAEGTATDGIELNRNDIIVVTTDGDSSLLLNRKSSDGDIINFRKDNSAVGSIGTTSGILTINAAGTATSVAGIPFYSTGGNSIYTHDVSGTDDTAAQNAAYGFGALDAVTTGDHNTAIGYGALSGNTTGARNIALGRVALDAPDEENDNIAIGYNSLAGAIAGGEFNIAIGSSTLDSLTNADNNVAIGHEAGGALTTGGENVIIGSFAVSTGVLTGAQNVVIGRLAGQDLTSANKNTIVGWSAAKEATTAAENTYIGYLAAGTGIGTSSYNVAIGNLAAQAATSMSESTIIGHSAGNDNTTGSNILAIGYQAYDAADTENHNLAIGTAALGGAVNGGEFNVAIGNYTLDALTTADNNTSVGYKSGSAITTGSNNVFLGYYAALTGVAAANNVIIGEQAAVAMGTGDVLGNVIIGQGACGAAAFVGNDNVVIGKLAGQDMTSAIENVIVGEDAGKALSSGDFNTLIGRGAGAGLTTGHRTVFIGTSAGDGHDAETANVGIGVNALGGPINGGEFNVAIGNDTLDALTTADGSIAIGYQAGSSVTTGGDNTMVGTQAGGSLITGTGNTLIGSSAEPSANNGENQIVIGLSLTGIGDNRVHLGSSGGHVSNSYTANNTWTQASDERLKKNINEDNLGLSFINELKPVTFNWKPQVEVDPEFQATRVNKGEKDTETLIHGLIAQEVKAAMHKVGNTTFNGWSESVDGQEISREMFITPLIKAVQELSATVTTLQQEINTLKGE